MVNGKQTELPFSNDKTTIRRIGHSIRIDNEHGINVICDLVHDMCSVNVTGWYYGKTGGLFGTFDNEPFNDFMMADGKKTTGTEEFANSWTIGSKCRAVNHAHTTVADPESKHYKQCARYGN